MNTRKQGDSMKIYCCFTPAHEILLRQEFLPSIPETFSVHAESIELAGPGDFLSPEFLRCINRKMELVLESLHTNRGEVIVWADIDIRFFSLAPDDLRVELGEHDIAFQREGKKGQYVNTGFFVCRANQRLIDFFRRVSAALHDDPHVNEQIVVNRLLDDQSELSWTHLPLRYYARTHGWPPPSNLALYHANATMGPAGVARKLRQFRDLNLLRRLPILGLAITCIKFAPKRLKRLLTERLNARPKTSPS
jgi:nucleotide-diphospho-sugar transferase